MYKVHEDVQEDDEDVQDEDVQERVENDDVQGGYARRGLC